MKSSPLQIHFFAPASHSSNLHKSWLNQIPKDLIGIANYQLREDSFGFSGSVEQRLNELHSILESSDFYMARRGGWGCLKLMHELKLKKNAQPPRLCGFSDLTVLLNYLAQKQVARCFHGPMFDYPENLRINGLLQRSFEVLCVRNRDFEVEIQSRIINAERIEGPLIGGNLSVLCASMGTSFEPDFEGKVLFLEEINEASYRVDRMLTQLSLKSDFHKLNGIVFGAFEDCDVSAKNASDCTVELLIENFAHEMRIPCVIGAPIGHISDFLVLPLESNSIWSKRSKDKVHVYLKSFGDEDL